MTNLQDLLTAKPLRVRDGVLDFIDGSDADYCENFGDQWTRFRTVQLDSISGKQESRRRFFSETGWNPRDLEGKVLLDAGCGAGRFAEVALEAGARVIAADISEAAFQCRRSLERFPEDRYLVIRADLFALPLLAGSLDGI